MRTCLSESARRVAVVAGIVFLLGVFVGPIRASAHELRPAIAELFFEGGTYRVSVRLNLEAFLAGVDPLHRDTKDSPVSIAYDRLRALPPDALGAAFAAKREEFVQAVSVFAGNTRLPSAVLSLDVPPVGDLDLARQSTVVLGGDVPAAADALVLSWKESFGPVAIRLRAAPGPDGKPGEVVQSAYLKGGTPSPPFPIVFAPKQAATDVFAEYVVVGFQHILPLGLDHILFVVGLFLLSPRLGPLLWQVTSFTVAHTMTLALGMLGIVAISPAIVEPLIAASIVYVGVENVLTSKLHRWRPVVVFGFGLLHGLGFAGVLKEFGLATDHFVTGLIAFNIGVELGQLAVIAICYLVAGLWFGHKAWYRRFVTMPASVVVALVGAWWCFERVWG
ncbi:MAG: HupE/UreJ family protein [Alphaproteobacteria bacterium]|nr:HupE/UreJ family protein [Alphaproteobacteria bacterium]MBM3951469.1 HupE/UreJ family protein [Rhodospirillales bacterium]